MKFVNMNVIPKNLIACITAFVIILVCKEVRDGQKITKHFSQLNTQRSKLQTQVPGAYGRSLQKWIPNCKKIFLDLGANIGVTVKKLFEPNRYPESITLPYFRKTFGYQWLRKSVRKFPNRLCALGFEPNPIHQKRLKDLEKEYSNKNWNVHFFSDAVSNVDGKVTFYINDSCEVCKSCLCPKTKRSFRYFFSFGGMSELYNDSQWELTSKSQVVSSQNTRLSHG